jgi:integrase
MVRGGASGPSRRRWCVCVGVVRGRLRAGLGALQERDYRQAGLAAMEMHVLRYTPASLMFASGRNARQCSAILGHHCCRSTLVP